MTMPIKINIPPGVKKIGELYDTTDPDFLTEDMLLLKVKGFGIEVGWYPEHDPSGSFLINVYSGNWHNSLFTKQMAHIRDVAEFVDEWSQKLLANRFEYSESPRPTDEVEMDYAEDSVSTKNLTAFA